MIMMHTLHVTSELVVLMIDGEMHIAEHRGWIEYKENPP